MATREMPTRAYRAQDKPEPPPSRNRHGGRHDQQRQDSEPRQRGGGERVQQAQGLALITGSWWRVAVKGRKAAVRLLAVLASDPAGSWACTQQQYARPAVEMIPNGRLHRGDRWRK
jgi:hypothetical protein